MLRIALRSHRTGLIAMSLIGVLDCLFQGAGFAQAAGSTDAARAAFGQSMSAIAQQIIYLLPLPQHPETVGGYTQWRAWGFLGLIFSFWALFAASGAGRGDEDRGLVERWLAEGLSRGRIILVRGCAFAATAALVAALTGLATIAAGALAGGHIGLAAAAANATAIWVLSIAVFALVLLIAQAATSGRATTSAGALALVVLFVLDAISRINHSAAWLAWLSPFGLYNKTNAIVPGGSFDVGATVLMAAAGALLLAVAALAFTHRDLGGVLFARRSRVQAAVHAPSRNPFLGLPVGGRLWEQRWGLLWWSLGFLVLAAFLVSLVNPAVDLFRTNPALAYFLRGQGDPHVVFLGLYWFSIAALIISIYAIVQVSGWSAEDAEGRLEMTLAQPVARWRIVVERALTLTLASALIGFAGALGVALTAPGQGIHPSGSRLLVATLLLIPVATVFGAVGGLISAWRPRLATGVMAAVAGLSFLLQELAPLFKAPDWVLNLSVYQLYGTPLSAGVFGAGLWAMVAVSVGGFGLAALALQRRDLGT
ncbi:MAG: ABC transporter permease subunit [Candidatus Dormibacteraeota bacterium]|nr:ABC transporter permease subunit [Candidatus Dormibacteraeota bacterium]